MKSFFKLHRKATVCAAVVLVLAVTAAIAMPRLFKPDNIAQGSAKPNAIRLSKMNLAKSVSATGTLESSNSKTVTANVNNISVKKVLVTAGDAVKKGDELVVFDESDLKDAAEEAQQNLEDARSEAARSVLSARNKLSDAQETFAEEKAKQAKKAAEAKSEKSRAEKQVSKLKRQFAAAGDANERAKLSEQLAKAEEAKKQADTAYENALESQSASNKQNQSGIESAKEALETAQRNGEKSIKEAKRQQKQAKKSLAQCFVIAPMDGTVTSVSVEEGAVYTGGAIMQIEDITSFVVSSSVDEYDISSVKKGQKVVILTEAAGEEEVDGEITFVAPVMGSSQTQQAGSSSVGSASTESSGCEIKIKVKGSNDALKLGMTAKCSIILEEAEGVLAVPYDAVHTSKDGSKVIYVQKESASEGEDAASDYEEVTVTVGMESDYYVEVSGDGLREGMRVLIPTDETVSPSEENGEKDTAFLFGGGMPEGMGGNPHEGKGNGGPPQNMGGSQKGNN